MGCSQPDDDAGSGGAAAPARVLTSEDDKFARFLRLSQDLNRTTDTQAVASVVADAAQELIGWTFASVHVYDSSRKRLHLIWGQDLADGKPRSIDPFVFNIVDGEGISRVLNGPDIVTVADFGAADNNSLHPFGDQLPLLPASIFCLVRSLDRIVGLISFQCRTAAAYDEKDQEIACGLAAACAGALERAWKEETYKQSEANHELVIENVNDGIVISQDDHFVFFNNRFAGMLGYETEELQQKTYLDIYSPRGLEILYERAARRHAGKGVSDRYETVFRKKNGKLLPVEANIRIIDSYNGRKATFAVIRDISERKAAEEQLRKSDEELRTVFNAMTDTILILDYNGRYLNHRSAAKKVLLEPWCDLEGHTLHEIFSREKADYFLNIIRRAIDSNEILNIEYDLQFDEKTRNWYNATVSPLSDLTVLMVARDVTERREAEEELFRSNARYKALLDGSEDYIFVLDPELRFVHVNSAIGKRYGAQADDRIGKTMFEIYEDDVPPYVDIIRGVFETGKPATYDDDAIVRGKLVCTETVISPVFNRSGKVESVLGISRDVTSRRQSELALKQSEQRYAIAVRGANDGIWDWNLESDRLYVSPRWWAIIGKLHEASDDNYHPDEWLKRVHPADQLSLKEKIYDHINGVTSHLEDEHRIRHADGSYRWVLCRGLCVNDVDGKPMQMAGSMSDITDRKTAEEKLHYGATHDALTGLPNRACFLDFLEKAMARARRLNPDRSHFAILFLDLDRFKVVNDSLGHLAGDELIKTMALRVAKCVRPSDTVARLGGDEFTVLLEDLAHDNDAIRVAERIIREVSAPVEIAGVSVQTTASIGIAFDKHHYGNPDELLRDADTAMYRAKSTGRNRYQVFDQQMHALAMQQLHWESDLRNAVARQEFVMHYQPIYNVPTGQLSGFEALIRWNHPEQGLTFPGDFIPLAEETGMIIPIGWWIVEQACNMVVKWNRNLPKSDHLSVSINMSPRQIAQPEVARRIKFLIEKAGAAPSNVIIEITENILMDDSEHVLATMNELRDVGVRIDLDDFGTGYSSLSYISRYPLDMLKIDRSFVNELGSSANSQQIVKAMLDLAASLGLQVTAEGVETADQLAALCEMNCGCAQGHYFSKPVSQENTFKIIDDQFNFEINRTN